MKEDKNFKVIKFFNWVYFYYVIIGDWFVSVLFVGGIILIFGFIFLWEKLIIGFWFCDGCLGDKLFGWIIDVFEGICDIVRDWNKW